MYQPRSQNSLTSSIVQAMDSIPVEDNSVIVYDIDDTLISSGNTPKTHIIETYHYARRKGFKTVIVTARPGYDNNIKHTIDNLSEHGIEGYVRLYMLPPTKTDQAYFKFLARKDLHDLGYKVVMSLGDMPWDIGAYGGVGFRV